jgi:hypothetical protein
MIECLIQYLHKLNPDITQSVKVFYQLYPSLNNSIARILLKPNFTKSNKLHYFKRNKKKGKHYYNYFLFIKNFILQLIRKCNTHYHKYRPKFNRSNNNILISCSSNNKCFIHHLIHYTNIFKSITTNDSNQNEKLLQNIEPFLIQNPADNSTLKEVQVVHLNTIIMNFYIQYLKYKWYKIWHYNWPNTSNKILFNLFIVDFLNLIMPPKETVPSLQILN